MRSWFVIPAMGAVTGGAAFALGQSPAVAVAGAALAAVIRVLAGDSPAALSGAVVAPMLALASWADAGGPLLRAMIALAAAGWAITELARAPGSSTSPIIAVFPAALAGILDPAFIALVAVAGTRLLTLPWQRPRWAIAVPLVGALAILLAVLAGTAWPALGTRWFGAAHPIGAPALARLAAETLGPLTAVAALAGLPSLVRPRAAELALAASIAGAVLVDLRAGALGAEAIGLAAVLSGLAISRLAAMIRIPSGQAITGATIGALVVAPPAWSALEHRPHAAHIAQRSR